MTVSKPLFHLPPACNCLSIRVFCIFAFALLFSFASSASGQQAILTVQHNSGTTESGASVAVAYNSDVTSGNLLLVAESSYDGVSLAVPTDTLNNSFVTLVTKGTTGASVAAIYAATANASGADTVTCGVNSSNNIHCHIYEVQGVTTTVDQTGNSSVTSESLSVSTSAATTHAVDYVLAMFSDNGGSNYTPGSGWGDTEQSNNTYDGGDSAFSEDQVVTATGVQTATATANASGTYVNVIVALVASGLPPVATPVFSPVGGNYLSGQSVSISDTTSGASIYYTTNGSTPTTDSPAYSGAIAVSASETLEAIATAPGYAQSALGSAAYTIGAFNGPIMTVQHNSAATETGTSLAVPFKNNITSGHLLLVAESSYAGVSLLTPTDSKGNTFTQLVIGGTDSGDSVAAIYSATANASGADTVTCGISASNNIHCHIYEVEGVTSAVDQTGTLTVDDTSLTVSTSSATTNAVDYLLAYFSDNGGSNYTPGSGWGDTEQSNNTVNGGDSGFSEDQIAISTGTQTATATADTEGTFVNVIVALKASGTPTASTPTFSPSSPGPYTQIQTVTISDWTTGASIYYTTDGSTPTTSSMMYAAPVTVSVTQTLQAIAAATGFASSPVGSASYIVNLPADTPAFSPSAGSYATAQSVTISDGTPDATIYYTTDNTTPTTSSAVYSSPITVSAWETIEAIATAPGSSQSATGVAPYTVGNPAAPAPTFSPSAGNYSSSQSVAISDAGSGATIYYTTDGSTPTTGSAVYSSAITVSATETVQAIAIASGYAQSGVGVAAYTINSAAGTCANMSLGRSIDGTADLNGFVPFQSATDGVVSLWNTDIANAPVDPSNASAQASEDFLGKNLHVNFGANSGDGGIPYMIVDSGTTPAVPINVYGYTQESDVVVAPYPNNVPIEGNPPDCLGWPDGDVTGDQHSLVLDRNGCWVYEAWITNRCNGLYSVNNSAIWDLQDGNYRPWGWSSADAGGLSVMAGLTKYDEAASGTIRHAIRYTMQHARTDSNNGYFVEPASHASGGISTAPTVEGMRLRLKSSFDTSGYSAINKAILTAMQQYGLIMADIGGSFFVQGSWDPRWDDSDLSQLNTIPVSDFEVVQSTPAWPGWDSASAPTGPPPVINSFTASPQTVSAGSPVTFNISVSGDSYDYIDMNGPVRLTKNGGGPGVDTASVTIYPTATQSYMLYSLNQYGDNQAGTFDNSGIGPGYGVTVSNPITIVVPGSVVAPPIFTPLSGAYATTIPPFGNTASTISSTNPLQVTLNTTTYPYAAFYYTTDGTTPTYPPTGTTITYPTIYQPMSGLSNTSYNGRAVSIPVTTNETINAIAVAPGYASPSAVSSATYEIGPITATPTFSPAAAQYGTAQTVTIGDTTSGATIYYTTNGATPTTASPTYSAAITVSANETLQAMAISAGSNNSSVASAAYIIGGTAATPTFSPYAGNYIGTQTVTISDASSGATIYYTTDGSTPMTGSSVYSTPITVSTSKTLEAIATGSGYTSSAAGSSAYTITTITPSFSPAPGTYHSTQMVTISDSTSGATIYYTTDGSTPNTGSAVYSTPVTVAATETINAIATSAGNVQSAVAAGIYTLVLPAPTPTFAPAAGNYPSAQTVTISDSAPGASIYYTTDYTTPTTNSTVYNGPITIAASSYDLLVQAVATANGYITSLVGSAIYSIGTPAATPTFSPVAGTYTSGQLVTISSTTPSAVIYYTTDGTAPTYPISGTTQQYTAAITVSATETVNAIAVAAGYAPSLAGSAAYTISPPQTWPFYDNFDRAACTSGCGSGGSLGPNYTQVNTTYPVLLISDAVSMEAWTNPDNKTFSGAVVTQPGYTFTANQYAQTVAENIVEDPNGYQGSIYLILHYIDANDFNYVDLYRAVGPPELMTVSGGIATWVGNYSGTITPGHTYRAQVIGNAYTLYDNGVSDGTLTTSVNSAAGPVGIGIEGYSPNPGSAIDFQADNCTTTCPADSTVATPTFNPAAGSYSTAQSVTISDTTPSATIFYTTDGTTPTASSVAYSTPLTVSTSQTLQAIAMASGYAPSVIGSAAYTVTPSAAMPTFSPAAGSYLTAQTVTISDSTSNSTIYYTTNGSTPTTSSPAYTGPIAVTATETINAIAAAAGLAPSIVSSATYSIGPPAATPTFSPAAGTYTSSQSVTISDTTGSSTIYYTTDGTTPTTGSAVYSTPISVSATETLNAIATASGYLNSAVGSAAYTINTPVAATPTFSPAAGTYTSTQTVTISDTTPSSAIYYTTDGTTPTYPISGTTQLYSSAITVSATETVNAIAVAAGYVTSTEGTAAYTISPLVSWPFFDSFDRAACTSGCGSGAGLGPDYTQINATYPVTILSDAASMSPWSSPSTSIFSGAVVTQSGYTFTANQYAQAEVKSMISDPDGYAESIYLILRYADANDFNYVDFYNPGTIYLYTVSGGTTTWVGGFSDGVTEGHTYRVQVIGNTYTLYDNGVSKGSLTTSVNSSAGPTGIGIQGDTDEPGSAINFQANNCTTTCPADAPAATPTFSPAAGTYTSSQSVTISDATGGASIYYTTNGTTPTTSSSFYSVPITVSATETLNAIATASGYLNSAVGSAAYTLQLPQNITFTPSSPVTYGISPITLSATGGGSGEPVTYTYVSGPGTLSGTNNDTLTIT